MGFLKNAFSTRKAMQHSPQLDIIHEVTDEELKQLQQCFLEMMADFIRVCDENDLCYMVAGGTALGSVRHQGFIPWDDDVDFLMPREDLNRLVEIFDETMGDKYEMTAPNSKYQLESMITTIYKKDTVKASFLLYNAPFPKGVHMDLFAIESVPVNPLARRVKGTTAMILQYIAVSTLFYTYRNKEKKEFFYQTTPGKINYHLRCMVGFLFSFRQYEAWGNLFDRFVRGKKDTGLWAVPTDIGHYFGHIMPKSVYYPPVKGPFEGMQVNLPHDVDAYLKNQYGDYMKIPPVEDREKHYSVGFDLGKTAQETEK